MLQHGRGGIRESGPVLLHLSELVIDCVCTGP
jgi:hypothetical protein